MKTHIARISLVIYDYDEAIAYYTEKLGFDVLEDMQISETDRWITVAPKGSTGFSLVLAKAATGKQKSRIGNQTGGRVFLFLYTDDFEASYQEMKEKDIEFISEPENLPWGRVIKFCDLYGNIWEMIQPQK